MQIDVYDFDKTVVPYDSALEFGKWCLLHRPYLILLLPFQLIWSLLALLKIISVPTYKKACFRFITFINTKKAVKKFWDKHEKDVYPFFHKQNRNSERKCVIVSASPDFLIEEIAARLNADYCIATHHSEKTGKLLGKVCRREEKVTRLKAVLPDAEICDVYSDNPEDDRFLFALGKRRYVASSGALRLLED